MNVRLSVVARVLPRDAYPPRRRKRRNLDAVNYMWFTTTVGENPPCPSGNSSTAYIPTKDRIATLHNYLTACRMQHFERTELQC